MHFSSTKALALSLLAGQAVVAAPTRHGSLTDLSVRVSDPVESAKISLNVASKYRRSPATLAILREHLYGRATTPGKNTPGKQPLDKEPLISDPGFIQHDPNKSPSENDPTDSDPGSFDSGDWESSQSGSGAPEDDKPKLPMYTVDSEEWKENLPLVAAKGKQVKLDAYEAIDTKQPGDGMKEAVVGEAGLGYKAVRPWLSEGKAGEMSYLQDLFGLDLNLDQVAEDGQGGSPGSPPRKKQKTEVQTGEYDWKVRNIFTKNSAKSVQESAFSKRNKAVSVMMSDKKADTHPAESQARWTHIMYDSLKEMLGEEGLLTLKWINRHQVISETIEDTKGNRLDTPDAIEYAFRKLEANKDEVLVVDLNSEDPNMVEVADYLAAQTHVARVLQLLAEYREDFGYKKISKLHLLDTRLVSGGGQQTVLDINMQEPTGETRNENAYGIVIELTDAQPQQESSTGSGE